MGFTQGKIRNLFLFSTIISAVGLIATLAMKTSNVVSTLLAGVLFLTHLPVLWMLRRGTHPAQGTFVWMQRPAFTHNGFLL